MEVDSAAPKSRGSNVAGVRGLAWRRRQQQLRAFERHERFALKLAQAATVHHTHVASRPAPAAQDVAHMSSLLATLSQSVHKLAVQLNAFTAKQQEMDMSLTLVRQQADALTLASPCTPATRAPAQGASEAGQAALQGELAQLRADLADVRLQLAASVATNVASN